MTLIDTHTHLYSLEFDSDRAEVIARALEKGVSRLLFPAIDSSSHAAQACVAEAYHGIIFQMMGLHPTSVAADYKRELEEVERLLHTFPQNYVAVGEIGLDYYHSTEFAPQQRESLSLQLDWACKLHKPVSLHVRNAHDDLFEMLTKRQEVPRGVMHCFSGTQQQAKMAIEMGFMLGIGGVVTFKNSLLPAVVEATPIENILLETDAPYLAPHPYRGKRNESSYLVEVATKVAEIKGLTVEQVASVTSNNACKLFELSQD